MTYKNEVFEMGAVPLGGFELIASWRRPNEQYKTRQVPVVVITQAASSCEAVYEPAQSVKVHGREALLALRAAIDEALNEGVAA